jgi:hypothetical protein
VAPNNPVYLGQLNLSSIHPQKLEEPDSEGKFHLTFEMDEQKIWKIENASKNEDVWLHINLRGIAFIEEKGRTGYRMGEWSVSVRDIDGQTEYIKIPKSEWLSFLEKWGYGKYLLLDIPIEFEVAELKKQGLAIRLKEANKGLERIRDKLRKGEWIDLVKDCRPILDLLRSERELSEGISTREAIKKLIEESGLPRNYAEGIEGIIKGLVTFVQPTHHIVEGKEIKIEPPYDKEDALFVMATISTLLNMLTRKLIKTQ